MASGAGTSGDEDSIPQRPSVAIIVVNWNNYDDTAACLESLKQIEYPNFQPIVVDNGSTDGSLEKLQSEYERCKFVCNTENLGFAKGVNSGIEGRVDSYDYFLLLNNDMVLEEGALDLIVGASEASSTIGIVSPKTVYFDRDQIQTAGRRFNRLTLSFENVHEGMDSDELSGIIETEAVSGGCMLIKSRMISEIGILSENFFFGGEDVEFCLRARASNWEIVLQADASVRHKAHSSTDSDNRFLQYHSTQNKIKLGLKTGIAGKVGILYKSVRDFTRVVGLPLLKRKAEAKAIVDSYMDLIRGKTRKRTDLL